MSCLGPLIFCTELGATLISMTHFEPEAALDQIEQERATWLYSVFPPITMALIKHPTFEAHDLSRVRGLLNAAPPDTMRVIQAAFPQAIQVGAHFGMTEASGPITCNEWDATPDEQAETHGAPLPEIEVRVLDPETGDPLGPGQPGELLVRGRGLFQGYYRDPDLTSARMQDGWLHTGDLGVIDEKGLVTYMARIKDMLKVGGELSEDDVIGFCEGSIAGFKVPRHVRFVDEWPMSATKIQKFRLREQIEAELGAGREAPAGAARDTT
jgi:fatty-acyl-CoA synthase